jgi:hypothetical protein
MGMETPAIEPVIGLPGCAQAIGRPISHTLEKRLIVQVDFAKCGGWSADRVALHEMTHFRLMHHEGLAELGKNGEPDYHGPEFKCTERAYREKHKGVRKTWQRKS